MKECEHLWTEIESIVREQKTDNHESVKELLYVISICPAYTLEVPLRATLEEAESFNLRSSRLFGGTEVIAGST